MQEKKPTYPSASINLHDSLASQNYSPLGVSISMFISDIELHSEMGSRQNARNFSESE
ncbi:MAG: hypothetical protein SFU25_01735 [Candidatus Caenarcaniphilales bacterium]|nr:hypothetical protein [Candidatus Caenarcaniphilales bacterium]